MKGWKTRIPDHTGLRKRRRGQEKIRVGSEERTAGLEKKIPETRERSTNWAEGWKNKIWKEVSKYEGGGRVWKNKMLKEGSKNRAGEGWKKSGSQLPTQTMNALFSGKDFIFSWPYICINFDPPQNGCHLMMLNETKGLSHHGVGPSKP